MSDSKHVCRGVPTPYTTVSGKRFVHYVCSCGLLLAVVPDDDPSTPAQGTAWSSAEPVVWPDYWVPLDGRQERRERLRLRILLTVLALNLAVLAVSTTVCAVTL